VNDKLDPLIFSPDMQRSAGGAGATLPSEPPPATEWVVGPSTTPPPASTPLAPSVASSPSPLVRANTPRGILAPGSEFGVYRVGPCIGEGGMARVYQAEHAGLQRQVALKVLIDGVVGSGDDSHERFLREARIAAAIKHPNVVNLFDVGVHEGTPFLVMELLSGTDLESLLAGKGPLDEGFVIDIMIPIVAGLAAVHDAGVVHRDLKPGNIFLSSGRYEEVEPKLLDFGISKAAGAEKLKHTANGLLMGTPFYMSPEGLRGEEMTPQSDQYSLGVVMYECVTGVNPFSASNFAEIFQLIGSASYVAPSVTRPQLSKRVERIILRAMSLDPAERFADLRELGRELLLLAGQRTRVTWALSFGDVPRTTLANARIPQVVTPPAALARPNAKRSWLLALAGAGVCLVLAALLIGRTTTPESASPIVMQPAPAPTPLLAAPPEPVLSAAPRASVDATPTSSPVSPARRASTRHHGPYKPPVPDTAGPDRDLQWEVTTGVAPAPRPAARTGANGAPIFD
jgi:eukaryotic-like serine/threonine-protein kinase